MGVIRTAAMGIVTRRDLVSDRQLGQECMQVIHDNSPWILTGRYGNYEPLGHSFSEPFGFEFMQFWGQPFLWGNGSKWGGSIWRGTRFTHSNLQIRVRARIDEVGPELERLVKILATRLACDFGYLHFFGLAEAKLSQGRAPSPFQSMVTTHELRKGVPDLASVTIFGPPYEKMFGHDRLLSAPVNLVESLAEGITSLRLLEAAAGTMESLERLKKVREQAKGHLGLDAFWGHNESPAARIADFNLEVDPRKKARDEAWAKILGRSSG